MADGFNSVPRYRLPRHDWEGYSMDARRAHQQQHHVTSPMANFPQRTGSPSVAVFAEAYNKATGPASRAPPTGYQGYPHDGPQHVVDHQVLLQRKREEYERRLDAEARGEVYTPLRPYTDSFLNALPDGTQQHGARPAPELVATPEEVEWLNPAPIPPPVGWTGKWQDTAGSELILQLFAVSGVTPANSPSLITHFMYPNLISCMQRLMYGTYMILYSQREPPHERYFYVKPMPLANKTQYCPFLCYSTHKNSHQASDCIPLCNVMWVSQGHDMANFKKYADEKSNLHIRGPYVGKRRARCLNYGCFTVWVFDGKQITGLNLLATDPMVFIMWMKLFEDVSHMNAACDTTKSVRQMQQYLEENREALGNPSTEPQSVFGSRRSI